MKQPWKKLWIGLVLSSSVALTLAPAAWAENVAHCEALIMKVVADDENKGEAQIASYRPAVPFLASLYDEEEGHLAEIDGFPIRAIMCRRNTVTPAETDYPILATGLPFILSQDFDKPDTDILTMFWKDGAIDYVFDGTPLSEEAQKNLDDRLADFSERGINVPAVETEEMAEEDISAEIAEADMEDMLKSEAEIENQEEIKAQTETQE